MPLSHGMHQTSLFQHTDARTSVANSWLQSLRSRKKFGRCLNPSLRRTQRRRSTAVPQFESRLQDLGDLPCQWLAFSPPRQTLRRSKTAALSARSDRSEAMEEVLDISNLLGESQEEYRLTSHR